MAGAQINGHRPPTSDGWRIMGALRTLASAIPGRARIAAALGKTFGGNRDVYEALGYKKDLGVDDYALRYRRGGVAKRVIEAYPKATWGDGVQIFDDENASVQTEFQKKIEDEFKRLDVIGRMMRLDTLAGLGRYGVMLVGVDQDLAQEAEPGEVLYLQPLSEQRASIISIDDNERSPRYGLPKAYRVKLGSVSSGGASRRSREITVHHSHVIHFSDGALEDDVYGQPRLESIWNYLDDLDKLVGGGSEAAWRRAVNTLIFNLDPDAEVDDDVQEAMKEQIVEFEHNLRRMLALTATDVKSVDSAPFSFRENALMVVSLISATMAIPQRKLLGSERGELASTQDDKEMNDNVSRRRAKVADPALRQLVDRMIDSGQLPQPKAGKYEIAWPEEEELSEDEKASLVLKFAQANAANKSEIITVDEIRDRVLDLDPLPSVEDDTGEEEVEESDEPSGGGDDGEGGGGAVDGGSDDPASGSVARTAAAEPSWKKIHRVADAYEPRLRKAFDRAFVGARDLFPMRELEQAIESGDHARAERLLSEAVAGFGELLDKNLPREVATIFTGDKT